jgi:hypothetical protein
MSVRVIAIALVVFGLASHARAEEDEARQARLEKDWKELAEKEKASVQSALEEARDAFAKTDNDSATWSYRAGLEAVRKTRSKAAVPLLLLYLDKKADHYCLPKDFAKTLTILTGKNVPELFSAGAERVRKLVRELDASWWQAERDKITTDQSKMSVRDRARIVKLLVEMEASAVSGIRSDAASVEDLVTRMRGSPFPSDVKREDLSAALVPALLEEAEEDASRFAVAHLLAVLRKDDDAPGLSEAADDEKGVAGTRLAAVLALHEAGEDLRVDAVIALVSAKRREVRLGAILALALAAEKDAKKVDAKLEALLDDANREVRLAALRALSARPPEGLTARFEKMLLETGDMKEAVALLGILQGQKTDAATAAIVKLLEKTLEPSTFHEQVQPEALSAFSQATGHELAGSGERDKSFYAEQTKAALAWWKERGEKK